MIVADHLVAANRAHLSLISALQIRRFAHGFAISRAETIEYVHINVVIDRPHGAIGKYGIEGAGMSGTEQVHLIASMGNLVAIGIL